MSETATPRNFVEEALKYSDRWNITRDYHDAKGPLKVLAEEVRRLERELSTPVEGVREGELWDLIERWSGFKEDSVSKARYELRIKGAIRRLLAAEALTLLAPDTRTEYDRAETKKENE